MLLEQMAKYLPHILYGADGARAEQNKPETVTDAAMLPGMMVEGS